MKEAFTTALLMTVRLIIVAATLRHIYEQCLTRQRVVYSEVFLGSVLNQAG